jgi:hypothetical protein
MPASAPPVDSRSHQQLVDQIERLLRRYSSWRPAMEGITAGQAQAPDSGQALVRIFARLAELVIERLNQSLDKNFLAFLDLVGLELLPPQPARVPLTFRLAAGSATDALVPARTQVAALPNEGETEPILFETERELVVTRSQLRYAFTREPDLDRYRDHTADVIAGTGSVFPVFQADQPIEHRLYLGSSDLFGAGPAKKITLWIAPADPERPWLKEVSWGYLDGTSTTPKWLQIDGPVIENGAWKVVLNTVPAIPPMLVDGQLSSWLCCRLNPMQRRRQWLPDITTIKTSVDIVEQDLLPDLAFVNQVPLDPMKDFFPFGEKPKFNDTCYLGSDRAFACPGAMVTITVTLTNPSDEEATPLPARPSKTLNLNWEFWNGQTARWELLGQSGPKGTGESHYKFRDHTNAFQNDSATVTFQCPTASAPLEVNGQLHHWIRVRIVRGDYGSEAHYEPVTDKDGKPILDRNTNLPIYQLTPADFRPPSVKRLVLSYEYDSPTTAPDTIVTENDFVYETVAYTPGHEFFPFTPPHDNVPTFYLGFQRPGAKAGFANRLTSLFFGVPDVLYTAGGEGQASSKLPPAVVWQYWNGTDWAQLGTRDETQGFTRRGLVSFVGPADFYSSTEFGQAAFWLRARWESGEYGSPPQLHRVLTNTTWATQARTIQNETLGSSNAEPNQIFRTAKAPVLPYQLIEIREPELPSAAERAVIEREEGADAITTLTDASGRPTEIWVRWHEMPDLYESGPRSRHYVLNRLTGEIHTGDGRRGLIPPRGRANVRARWYQAGGGPQGNRPAGNVIQLKTTVPYVEGVTNWEPASGGAGQETLAALKSRGPKTLRHRDRAVTAADCEDLALQASTDVALVKSISARHSSDAGRVGVIVVPRSTDPQPVPTLGLLDRVESYLRSRLAPTVTLWVGGPDWVRVDILAEVAPVSPEAATDVQSAVLARLRTFLHPLTGGPNRKGWDFGRQPYRSDLYAVIEGTPGVDNVRLLQVTATPEGNVRPERFLVFSGDHQITMMGGEVEG